MPRASSSRTPHRWAAQDSSRRPGRRRTDAKSPDTSKGAILPYLPVKFDFEAFELSNTTTNTVEPPTAFAYPPLLWNSARFRFEVRNQTDASGATSKALVKTIDNKLFQRGQIFFGFPDRHELHHRGRRAQRGEPSQDVRGRAHQSALCGHPQGQLPGTGGQFKLGTIWSPTRSSGRSIPGTG